ncbi:MAG: hypothetical protein ACYDER_20600 [Ktedonobacteraceae bacterium]
MEMPSQRGYVANITIAWYVLFVWFFLVLGASVSGWFLAPGGHGLMLLGLAVGAPVLFGFLLFFASRAFRRFVRSINPVTITSLQSYRVIGVATLVLYSWHQLPALFAMPVGWGDFFIGSTASLAALALASGTRSGKVIFILWSVLGILDLVDGIVLGIAIQVGWLPTAIDTSAMSLFGMSLITAYLVPISILLHLIGLSQLRKGPTM